MAESLERIYRGYLGTLNERRFGDLGQFVHDVVVRNGQTLTSQQYAQFIADDVDAIPDLTYTIDQLVGQGFGAWTNANAAGCDPRNCSIGSGCATPGPLAATARRNSTNSSTVRVGNPSIE